MVVNAKNNHARTFERRDFIKSALTASLTAPVFAAQAFSGFSKRASASPVSDAEVIANSPYGVCSHLGGGEEFDQIPQNLEMMKKAGIRWARADFSWIGVEPSENEWRFEHLDKVVAATKEVGIQVLPILDYDVPWASPAYKNLDKWLAYVRKTVERYKDQIRYWEVWNEENLKGFWHDDPDAEQYARLLKETYKTIKAIDPELIVVYGGLAGVPIDFFEKSLDAGVADFFDVVNIHPYRGGLTTRERVDKFQSEIGAFNAALTRRGYKERPIWITEMGWATPPIFGDVNRRVVAAAIQRLYPNELPRVAFFYDDRYDPASSRPRHDFYNYLPDDYRNRRELTSFLDADQLKSLSTKDVDMLVMPPSETFPSDCFDAVAEFVKEGGTLVLNGGVPLYYECWIDEKTGQYRQGANNPKFGEQMQKLHMSWYAWWTRENVPESLRAVVAAESVDFKPTKGTNAFDGFFPVHEATRFFDDKALKDGDRMIALIEGRNETFCGVAACIYDLNSDYKGAVVVNSVSDHDGTNTNVSTVADQAVFLSQAYLLAFAAGVERFFWYEFQAPQRDPKDPEHHFGVVGQKLDPKPAYYALSALTKARPAGSKQSGQDLKEEDVVVSWDRPDGMKGWALWTSRSTEEKTLTFSGSVKEAFDYLGNEAIKPKNGAKINVAPGVLYLIGPDSVSLE